MMGLKLLSTTSNEIIIQYRLYKQCQAHTMDMARPLFNRAVNFSNGLEFDTLILLTYENGHKHPVKQK